MTPADIPEPDETRCKRIIDEACNGFESKFRESAEYRIEEFVKSGGLFAKVDSFEDGRRNLLAELILLEMFLRNSVGDQFTLEHYRERFAGQVDLVDAAWIELQDRETTDFAEDSLVASIRFDPTRLRLTPSESLPIPPVLGRFADITPIGDGGFGVVCRATDGETGELRALKFPKKADAVQALEEAMNEVDLAMELDHPSIVKTYGLEVIDPYAFVVQQFVEGMDLKKAMVEKNWSYLEIAELVWNIATALQYASEIGLTHRDIKPANILLDGNHHPYVADFGLAFHERDQDYLPEGRAIGSPAFMSPEQIRGQTRILDTRTDIFSLGVLFYEMLVGRRPFRGSREQIEERIQNFHPRSPRSKNGRIPKELDRICMRCLEKSPRDRFNAPQDLADDLRFWIDETKRGTVDDRKEVEDIEFVPKGLRSYGPEDSQFFLHLLPGPRDRNGIPASVRFWTTRISEPVPPELRVPVGAIYGPSGSGKSSFVKAGLLPQLKQGVETIYIESTRQDTEVRLMKSLRDRFSQIPEDVSLPQMLRGLARGMWGVSDKLLIVLDQFEQRLSLGDDNFRASQLAEALGHCDGERMQTLLLVRDDFCLGLTRFLDALDTDWKEGENVTVVDLFDQSHARQILTLLGQAYGALPKHGELSDEAERFLDEAVDQLATDGYVICVRLTLFAELFKGRPWTMSELKSVGGAKGVGEKFLESTFGSSGSNRRYQLEKEKVQAILEELLPTAGSSIRGVMKSEAALLKAAKCEGDRTRFNRVIQILDSDLKLISKTDPDESGDSSNPLSKQPATESSTEKPVFYQLTHDYLVPSVRDWLTTVLRSTRRGRAKIRLRELAAEVVPGEPLKRPPTFTEWFSWQLFVNKSQCTPSERSVIKAGTRAFWRNSGIVASVLAVIVAVFSYLRYLERSNTLVQKLFTSISYPELPSVAKDVQFYPAKVKSRVQQLVVDESIEPRVRDQLKVILFSLGEEDFETHLISLIVHPETTAEALEGLTTILIDYGDRSSYIQKLRSIYQDLATPSPSRFRAMVSLVAAEDSYDWKDDAPEVASLFVEERTLRYQGWIRLLSPVGRDLLDGFAGQFGLIDDFRKLDGVAAAIREFDESRTGRLSQLLIDSNEVQFDAILGIVELNQERELMKASLQEFAANRFEGIKPRLNHAAALFRLGSRGYLKAILQNDNERPTWYSAVSHCTRRRIGFEALKELYQANANDLPALRNSLLLVFANRVERVTFRPHLTWLNRTAEQVYLEDLDGGCFSAADLILRRMASERYTHDLVKMRLRRQKELGTVAENQIFINSSGMAFRVFERTMTNGDSYRFGVLTTEMPTSNFAKVLGLEDTEDIHAERPVESRDPMQIIAFCNQLTLKHTKSEQDLFYPVTELRDLSDFELKPIKPGYRLMTIDEWSTISGSDAESPVFGLNSNDFVWNLVTSNDHVMPVGTKLPSRSGLFDLGGNGEELALGQGASLLSWMRVGGSYRGDPFERFSPKSNRVQSKLMGGNRLSLRPVLTLSQDEQ